MMMGNMSLGILVGYCDDICPREATLQHQTNRTKMSYPRVLTGCLAEMLLFEKVIGQEHESGDGHRADGFACMPHVKGNERS